VRHYTPPLAGAKMNIWVPESEADIDAFYDWIVQAPDLLGFDTETSGLEIFSADFELRTAQFGDHRTGWVLRVDQFREVIVWALRSGHRFAIHNAAFDLLVVDQCLGVTVEELAPRIVDTKILSHLVDPRQAQEGGTGHALKPLSQKYVDRNASDGQKELQAEFRKIGANKDTGWAKINIDNPAYELYAGLDPILAIRMHDALQLALKDYGVAHLVEFEHELQRVILRMQRRGMLVDVPYTERLRDDLQAEATHYRAVAARYGVENINSTKQLAVALEAMGETLRERTASGATKVDKSVLQALADFDTEWNPRGTRDSNKLAEAVLHAKRAAKWSEAYLQAMLNRRDSRDRIHPSINALAARTGRMSVSGIPLQQLPSKEHRIRRALVADPGHVIVSSDYSQVELVMLAAMSQDPEMLRAVRGGADLHSFATEKVYGPKSGHESDELWTKHRKICKAVSLGRVYGGGATTIQRQTGAPMEGVKAAIAAYDAAFPGVKALGHRLQRDTQYGAIPLITPSGRRLPLDRDRTYAATNFLCQGTSRDVLAQAILDIDEAGLGDYMLLPIHDELLCQVPEADAEDAAKEIERIMSRDLFGVPFRAKADVFGRSWGDGYA